MLIGAALFGVAASPGLDSEEGPPSLLAGWIAVERAWVGWGDCWGVGLESPVYVMLINTSDIILLYYR